MLGRIGHRGSRAGFVGRNDAACTVIDARDQQPSGAAFDDAMFVQQHGRAQFFMRAHHDNAPE